MKKGVPILLVLLIFPLFLCSMTRIYEEKTGQLTTLHRFEIESAPTGYFIRLQSQTGDEVIKQTFILDNTWATFSWSFDHPANNTHVSAVRKGVNIFLQGRDKGKPVTKTFEINNIPWNQTFNIGLERFILSGENTMVFWAIGTKGQGNMRITKFKVKKRGSEKITIAGSQVEAVHITISLTGLLSMFWTGHYWYRETDGWFLRYKGKNGPGKPMTVMELLPEAPK